MWIVAGLEVSDYGFCLRLCLVELHRSNFLPSATPDQDFRFLVICGRLDDHETTPRISAAAPLLLCCLLSTVYYTLCWPPSGSLGLTRERYLQSMYDPSRGGLCRYSTCTNYLVHAVRLWLLGGCSCADVASLSRIGERPREEA